MQKMEDPIFGQIGKPNGKTRAPAPQESDEEGKDEVKLEGVPVETVPLAQNVMTLANALGHNCILFVFLEGCPFCVKFQTQWNAACRSNRVEALWLHCVISDMQDARSIYGNVTFPCLVANGRVFEEHSNGKNTSEMAKEDIIAFAGYAPEDDRLKNDRILADDSDDTSEHSSETTFEDEEMWMNDYQNPTAHEEKMNDEFLQEYAEADDSSDESSESLSEDNNVDDADGFQYTLLISDLHMATPERPILTCYYGTWCPACKNFQSEWNTIVQQALMEDVPLMFAVANIEDFPEEFARTKSTTIPHINLHTHQNTKHTCEPGTADKMWKWIWKKVRR